MPSARNRDLLPGVKQKIVPPTPAARDLASVIQKARLKRLVRDVVDVLILLLVDVLFLAWPGSHIPFLSRQVSGNLLILAHLVVMGHWIITRSAPGLRAKRIAETWSSDEKAKKPKK